MKPTPLRPPPIRRRKGLPTPDTIPTMFLHLGKGRVMTFDNLTDARKFVEARWRKS